MLSLMVWGPALENVKGPLSMLSDSWAPSREKGKVWINLPSSQTPT